MCEIIWQLPVKQSNKSNHDWIHPKAKYHAFKNRKSICNKYYQNTDYFDTTINKSQIMSNKQKLACKKCLKGLNFDC